VRSSSARLEHASLAVARETGRPIQYLYSSTIDKDALARQLQAVGRTDFKRLDNCFTWLGYPKFAQRLADRQLTIDWPRALSAIARRLNPLHAEIFKPWPLSYYCSAYQTEWATDVLFRDPRTLAAIYPASVDMR
jgi:hypothetical protein